MSKGLIYRRPAHADGSFRSRGRRVEQLLAVHFSSELARIRDRRPPATAEHLTSISPCRIYRHAPLVDPSAVPLLREIDAPDQPFSRRLGLAYRRGTNDDRRQAIRA